MGVLKFGGNSDEVGPLPGRQLSGPTKSQSPAAGYPAAIFQALVRPNLDILGHKLVVTAGCDVEAGSGTYVFLKVGVF